MAVSAGLQQRLDERKNQVAGLFGVNLDRYLSATGTGASQWAQSWMGQLEGLSGYYNQSDLDNMLGQLGTASSDTYINQLHELTSDYNRLYSISDNVNYITDVMRKAAVDNGGRYVLAGGTEFYANQTGPDRSGASAVTNAMYSLMEDYSARQSGIVEQISAQQAREQSFISQINQLTQSATLAKSKAEQAAAQQAMQQQYAEQQAALDAQAQENAAQLAESQRQQDEAYAKAQAEHDEAARKQQESLNLSAETRAVSAAAQSQVDQARISVQQQEQQAGQVRGGEVQVSTNAASNVKGKSSTRAERWQAARAPAAGGGGLRI